MRIATKFVVCIVFFAVSWSASVLLIRILFLVSVIILCSYTFLFSKQPSLIGLGLCWYPAIVNNNWRKEVRALVRKEDFLGNVLVQFLAKLFAWAKPTSLLIRHSVVRLTLRCIDIWVATNNSAAAAAASVLADQLVSQQMDGCNDQMPTHWLIIMHSPLAESPGRERFWL